MNMSTFKIWVLGFILVFLGWVIVTNFALIAGAFSLIAGITFVLYIIWLLGTAANHVISRNRAKPTSSKTIHL